MEMKIHTTAGPSLIEGNCPVQYRLAVTALCEPVLQGAFEWIEYGIHGGPVNRGLEWRDLPTFQLDR